MKHTQASFLLLSLWIGAIFSLTSLDPDVWVPDQVSKKADPFNLIAKDEGQKDGEYNWNTDVFELMGRTQKTCDGCTENGAHIIIGEDLSLYVNDKEFFIEAVCYNPVPLGVKTMSQAGIGGGGLCSNRRTAFGEMDYKSACYDSDYFDGSSDHPDRDPPGPSGGWFNNLWVRDFPYIKEAGANTIRIYNTNPTTRQYTEQVLNGDVEVIDGEIVEPPLGNDHIPFMDAAQATGLMVIFPLLGDEGLMKSLPTRKYERFLENQIDEVGNHPALLMYTVGNELDIIEDTVLLDLVNYYTNYARNYSMTKWGRKIPFTHAIIDFPESYDFLFKNLDVDIFTSNAGYRGTGFQDLWDGQQTNGFSGLGPLSLQYKKPNFIGEMGWHQINGSQTAGIDGWFNSQWKSLLQSGMDNGCIGGAFFEYSDEPYSKDEADQQSMGMVSFIPTDLRDFPATTGRVLTQDPSTTRTVSGTTESSTNRPTVGSTTDTISTNQQVDSPANYITMYSSLMAGALFGVLILSD